MANYVWKQCISCGSEYITHQRPDRSLWCSVECRGAWRAEQARSEQTTCAVCGRATRVRSYCPPPGVCSFRCYERLNETRQAA